MHEGQMGLFTVNFELGEKTLQTLVRVSETSVVSFELGPETRSMIERLLTPVEDGDRPVAGLVKKGAEALRRGS
jgi:hypothetical protein